MRERVRETEMKRQRDLASSLSSSLAYDRQCHRFELIVWLGEVFIALKISHVRWNFASSSSGHTCERHGLLSVFYVLDLPMSVVYSTCTHNKIHAGQAYMSS